MIEKCYKINFVAEKEDVRHTESMPHRVYLLFVKSLKFFSRTEKERDAPNAGKGNQGVDDTAYKSILTAAKPCYYVELKKTDASPVECADDGENKRNSIQDHKKFLPADPSERHFLREKLRRRSVVPFRAAEKIFFADFSFPRRYFFM